MVSYQSELLLHRRYYDSSIINEDRYKEGLIHGIESLAENMKDEILKFTLGTYTIVALSKEIPFADMDTNKSRIHIFCIVNKNTEIEPLRKAMKIILESIINRFTSFDILNHNKEKFINFNDRIDQILGDLIFKSEDRFRNVFS